jgi:regulator of RNase E activity RraA
VDGPSTGDNAGNAIYTKSGNGIVYDGAVRDMNGLEELRDFVAFVRYYDPSHHYGSLRSGKLLNSTMVSINAPTRIGHASVMPGDVVLGRNGGVIFRVYPPSRCLWPSKAGRKDIHRRTDRRPVDAGDRRRLTLMVEAE